MTWRIWWSIFLSHNYQEWFKEGRKKFPKMWWYKRNKLCFGNKGWLFYEKCIHEQLVLIKKDKIYDFVEKLLQKGESYLRHRSHVDISEVFPHLHEAFIGKQPYIKTKNWSPRGSLFWETVFPPVEPGENKYFYHVSDDTNHDPVFVYEVLENIFQRWNINNETVIINIYNTITQYQHKYGFQSRLYLFNKYNVRIIRNWCNVPFWRQINFKKGYSYR